MVENGSTTGQSRQAAERGFVSACFGGPGLPRCLQQLFLWFSALHYCWQGCRYTKAERDLYRQVIVRGSVSAHIMADTGTPRCLQVSAVLCIVFYLY
jgi:hypothetical protein